MRACILTLAVLALPAATLAQQPAPHTAATITVTAQGEFKAAPDTAVVSLEVSGQNADLQTAYAQAQSQASQVRSLLRQQGFTAQAAHWSGFQVQPNLDYKTQRVTSYTVRNDLELELTDFAKIGPLLNAATGAGLNALRNVSFKLSKMEAAKAAAIADGYGKAKQEAEALARAAGSTLGGLKSATVDTSGGARLLQPRIMAMASLGGAPAPTAGFTPQQITVTANITAVYWLQP